MFNLLEINRPLKQVLINTVHNHGGIKVALNYEIIEGISFDSHATAVEFIQSQNFTTSINDELTEGKEDKIDQYMLFNEPLTETIDQKIDGLKQSDYKEDRYALKRQLNEISDLIDILNQDTQESKPMLIYFDNNSSKGYSTIDSECVLLTGEDMDQLVIYHGDKCIFDSVHEAIEFIFTHDKLMDSDQPIMIRSAEYVKMTSV